MKRVQRTNPEGDGRAVCENVLLRMQDPRFISFEHPLNHGKRLGIIRFKRGALSTNRSINALQNRLRQWQDDDKILAVWFEDESPPFTKQNLWSQPLKINDTTFLNLPSVLIKQIKLYPKSTLCWCGYSISPALRGVLALSRIHLLTKGRIDKKKRTHPFEIHKTAKVKWVESKMAGNSSKGILEINPTIYSRIHLLELVSSHPWHHSECLESELKLLRILGKLTSL